MSGERERWIAAALVAGRRNHDVLEVFPGTVPRDLVTAELIQEHAIEVLGERIVGWKVGLIPNGEGDAGRFVGPVFDISIVDDGAPPLIVQMPRGDTFLEVEWIAELLTDLEPMSVVSIAPDELPIRWHLGVELCGSAVADLRRYGPFAVCADLGINAGLVVGPAVSASECTARAEIEIDGTLVGEGDVGRIPGGIGSALAAGLQILSRRGRRVAAGTFIATGTVTGAHPVHDGATVRVRSGRRELRLGIEIGAGL